MFRSKLQFRSGIISETSLQFVWLVESVTEKLKNVTSGEKDAGSKILDISTMLLNSTEEIIGNLLSAASNLSGTTTKLDLIDKLIKSMANLINSAGTSFGMLLSSTYTVLSAMSTSDQKSMDAVINSTTELLCKASDPLENILNMSSRLITNSLQSKINVNNEILNATAMLLNVTAETLMAMLDTTSTILIDISEAKLDKSSDVARLTTALLKASAIDQYDLLESTSDLINAVLITDSKILKDLISATEKIVDTREAAKEDLMNVIVTLAESMLQQQQQPE